MAGFIYGGAPPQPRLVPNLLTFHSPRFPRPAGFLSPGMGGLEVVRLDAVRGGGRVLRAFELVTDGDRGWVSSDDVRCFCEADSGGCSLRFIGRWDAR